MINGTPKELGKLLKSYVAKLAGIFNNTAALKKPINALLFKATLGTEILTIPSLTSTDLNYPTTAAVGTIACKKYPVEGNST